MAAIDPSQFKALHKYFPDLTLTQLATAYMYSTGIPVGTICSASRCIGGHCQRFSQSSMSSNALNVDIYDGDGDPA